MNELNSDTRRLPLWKSFAENLIANGLTHGREFSLEELRVELGEPPGSVSFGFALHKLRKQLELSGFHLSGREGHGLRWVIIPAQKNAKVVRSKERASFRNMERALTLATHTNRSELDHSDRIKLDELQRRTGLKLIMLKRSQSIAKLGEFRAKYVGQEERGFPCPD